MWRNEKLLTNIMAMAKLAFRPLFEAQKYIINLIKFSTEKNFIRRHYMRTLSTLTLLRTTQQIQIFKISNSHSTKLTFKSLRNTRKCMQRNQIN